MGNTEELIKALHKLPPQKVIEFYCMTVGCKLIANKTARYVSRN